MNFVFFFRNLGRSPQTTPISNTGVPKLCWVTHDKIFQSHSANLHCSSLMHYPPAPSLTLNKARGCHHPPLLESRNFSRIKHPVDLRPVCKLKFVSYGPVEKKLSALSVSFFSWQPDKIEEYIFLK